MTDQPQIELADYLQTAEIEAHIDVEQEDSVRDDWWRASCRIHGWYTTGSRPNVEDAAAEHVAAEHKPCADPSPRTFNGSPLYCRMLPAHDDDHMNGGYTWPREPAPADGTGGGPPPTQLKMPTSERYHCPISTCSWTFDAPPALAVDPGVLAHIFGPGVMSLQATNQHHAKIERALEEHSNTHAIVEYVAEISKLTAQVIGLTAISRYGQEILDDLAQPMTGILGQYPTTGL